MVEEGGQNEKKYPAKKWGCRGIIPLPGEGLGEGGALSQLRRTLF